MFRISVLTISLLLAASMTLRANPANGNPRLERLFTTFIAPCCWQQNLLIHHSPQADEVRAQITTMVTAGRTDNEIKSALIEQYSIRILALPDGARGQWLTWTPILALLVGVGVVTLTIRRLLPSDRVETNSANASATRHTEGS